MDEPRAIIDLSKARRFGVRQLLVAVGVMALILLLLQGPSIRRSGEEMKPGVIRTAVLAVGKPAGWLGDRLPLHDATEDATAWLSPDDDLGDEGGFETVSAPLPADGTGTGGTGAASAPAAVTPDAFAPSDLGQAAQRRPLKTVLVTGDSLSQPLDQELARRLGERGVEVTREPHLGTGISKTDLLDWGKLSVKQAKQNYDAIVMFMGANEGFDMQGPDGNVKCCGADWAAVYATRARAMMNAYRRAGAGRVYWLTLPGPKDADRIKVAKVVNSAIVAAAAPYRAQVRVVDMVGVFTPNYDYRDSLSIGGRDTIVRRSDGIHLNDDGAKVAADSVQRVMAGDFTW